MSTETKSHATMLAHYALRKSRQLSEARRGAGGSPAAAAPPTRCLAQPSRPAGPVVPGLGGSPRSGSPEPEAGSARGRCGGARDDRDSCVDRSSGERRRRGARGGRSPARRARLSTVPSATTERRQERSGPQAGIEAWPPDAGARRAQSEHQDSPLPPRTREASRDFARSCVSSHA